MSIIFRLSQDPRLLEQYYQLREQCFREELGLRNFDGSEEMEDQKAAIVLGVKDGRCVAGARISPIIPSDSQIQELAVEHSGCCMWERLVTDPAVRTEELFYDFCSQMVELSYMIGYNHALVLSTLATARFYRRCHSTLGVNFHIHSHVPECAQGRFASLEHYLSIATLRKSCFSAEQEMRIAI